MSEIRLVKGTRYEASPPDDLAEFALSLDELDAPECRIDVGAIRLSFQTARERLAWSDGLRFGLRARDASERKLAWLVAFLDERSVTDEWDVDDARRRQDELSAEMTEAERVEIAALGGKLDKWMKSLTTKSAGVVK